MQTIIGFIAAAISALAWGSYLVPMRRIKQYDPFYFQAIMCAAIFLSSLVISFLYNSFAISYYGLLSGILWSIGNAVSIIAVKNLGLSKAAPLWVGILIFTSFAWGILFIKEQLSSLFIAILGLILLIISIVFISSTMRDKASSNKGIIPAIIAGLIFGSYLIPLKLSGLEPIPFLFPMSLGILIGGLSIFHIKKSRIDKKIIIPGFFSGLLWNIANFASFFVVINLGYAVGFPLTQTALFVAVMWGLLYFREIQDKKKIKRIVIGTFILFAGVTLLGISKI
jgi:glucose uptake protein